MGCKYFIFVYLSYSSFHLMKVRLRQKKDKKNQVKVIVINLKYKAKEL